MEITAQYVREHLDYNPDTGEFFWKKPFENKIAKRIMGVPVGSRRKDGYMRIGLAGKRYLSHRIAWLHFYGEWPSKLIDHVNLNPSDNRISNLRLATHAQNKANRDAPETNKSGFKGVHWNKRNRTWFAQIKVNGKQIYLGSFKTIDEANAARIEGSIRHCGDYAR